MLEVPFTNFNYKVLISVEGESGPLCDGGFSECSGLEQSTDVTTIRQGGDNGRQIHLSGPISNGELSLKRGMTSSFDLWHWFQRVNLDDERHLRANVEVVMLHSDRTTEQVSFALTGCLPTKLVAPPLVASGGELAIEELAVAYETLRIRIPGATR